MRALALGDDEVRADALRRVWGDRLPETWLRFKVRQWRAAAGPAAVAAYVEVFGRQGMPDPVTAVEVPVLAVTGEEDAEPMRAAAVRAGLAALCPDLEVVPLLQCGHYPMQEVPVLLAAVLERFLRRCHDTPRPAPGGGRRIAP